MCLIYFDLKKNVTASLFAVMQLLKMFLFYKTLELPYAIFKSKSSKDSLGCGNYI